MGEIIPSRWGVRDNHFMLCNVQPDVSEREPVQQHQRYSLQGAQRDEEVLRFRRKLNHSETKRRVSHF